MFNVLNLCDHLLDHYCLLLFTLLLKRNIVMALVVCFNTKHINKHLIISTKQLQRLLMFLSCSPLYSPQGPSVCVSLVQDSMVRFQVRFTVRGLTHPTGLQCFQLSVITDVTQSFRFGLFLNHTKCCVDNELRSFTESFFTGWTVVVLTVVQALVQAALNLNKYVFS